MQLQLVSALQAWREACGPSAQAYLCKYLLGQGFITCDEGHVMPQKSGNINVHYFFGRVLT
jgi:hypothetical protein